MKESVTRDGERGERGKERCAVERERFDSVKNVPFYRKEGKERSIWTEGSDEAKMRS